MCVNVCVCVCRPGSRTKKNRRGATGDQGGRWPTKTPLWSRENVPAVGPFVFVMLGPQKSLSASFVVDAKGSQSDMAPWAGLAICGSPLRGDDVQMFKFSSASANLHMGDSGKAATWRFMLEGCTGIAMLWTFALLRKAANWRHRLRSLCLHVLVIPEPAWPGCSFTVHCSHCLESVQFMFTP